VALEQLERAKQEVPEGGSPASTTKKEESVPRVVAEMEVEPIDFSNDDELEDFFTTSGLGPPPERGSTKRQELRDKLVKQNLKRRKKCP